MIHRITIRELNTLGNQLTQGIPFKKAIQNMVLEAVAAGQTYILFDDQDEVSAIILEGIPLAKIEEKLQNRGKRMVRSHFMSGA